MTKNYGSIALKFVQTTIFLGYCFPPQTTHLECLDYIYLASSLHYSYASVVKHYDDLDSTKHTANFFSQFNRIHCTQSIFSVRFREWEKTSCTYEQTKMLAPTVPIKSHKSHFVPRWGRTTRSPSNIAPVDTFLPILATFHQQSCQPKTHQRHKNRSRKHPRQL